MQLMPYCVLVEDEFRTRPPHGIIAYSDRHELVPYTPLQREAVLNIVSEIAEAEGCARVLDTLAELGVGLCNIDQPLFHRSVKPAAHSISGIGYVRLHGRNYKEWFSLKADVRACFA